MVTEFVVVGDLSLDIVVTQSAARRDGSDVPAMIRIGPGGQGANVAVRLARQRAAARLVAPWADDAAGRLLREALHADGVTLAALPTRRSTVVLAMLDEAGERTMFSDRQTLDPDAVAGAIEGAAWLHCSGYPLLDDRTGDALAALLGSRPSSVRLSVAGGSVPPDPARVSRLRARLAAARPELILLSADEAESMLGRPSPRALAAATGAQELAPVVIVTAGASGSAAAAGAVRFDIAADDLPGPILDATGSGDAYVAGLLLELAEAVEWPPPETDLRRGMEAGSRLGAQVARAVGAQAFIDDERRAG
ncbi:MAG TPA: carbohydrate kinase family protein [Candidatus Limnocylindria bacterium]|nr:carbohydrate kinase family protein [Candidatus Limnocylindria bacterium]